MPIKKLENRFKYHQKQLYILAVSISKNREAAEDASHAALISVAHTNSEVLDLKAYLLSVVRNKNNPI